MATRIVSLFDRADTAERAQEDLSRSGFAAEDIQVIRRSATGTALSEERSGEEKSLWDKVKEFFGAEESDIYSEASRQGGTLLIITLAVDDRVDDATEVLDRHDPIDIDQRVEEWRQAGWRGVSAAALGASEGAHGVGGASSLRGELGPEVLPAEAVTAGPESDEESPRGTRAPAGRRIAGRGGVRIFSRPADVPAREEEARRQAEPLPEPMVLDAAEIDELEAVFRQDFDASYAGQGLTYEQMRPGYRFGRDLALKDTYQNQEWDQIESLAKRDYEMRHPGLWESMKNAIRRGFIEVRSRLVGHRPLRHD